MIRMPALSREIVEVKTAQGCMNAAQNAELVVALDQTITNWCKEIEKVLFLRQFYVLITLKPFFYMQRRRNDFNITGANIL